MPLTVLVSVLIEWGWDAFRIVGDPIWQCLLIASWDTWHASLIIWQQPLLLSPLFLFYRGCKCTVVNERSVYKLELPGSSFTACVVRWNGCKTKTKPINNWRELRGRERRSRLECLLVIWEWQLSSPFWLVLANSKYGIQTPDLSSIPGKTGHLIFDTGKQFSP